MASIISTIGSRQKGRSTPDRLCNQVGLLLLRKDTARSFGRRSARPPQRLSSVDAAAMARTAPRTALGFDSIKQDLKWRASAVSRRRERPFGPSPRREHPARFFRRPTLAASSARHCRSPGSRRPAPPPARERLGHVTSMALTFESERSLPAARDPAHRPFPDRCLPLRSSNRRSPRLPTRAAAAIRRPSRH